MAIATALQLRPIHPLVGVEVWMWDNRVTRRLDWGDPCVEWRIREKPGRGSG
jgi:hypothetical protein